MAHINTEKFEKIIRKKGIKKWYLVWKTGVSRTTFYYYVNNKRTPPDDFIKILCKELKIRKSRLII